MEYGREIYLANWPQHGGTGKDTTMATKAWNVDIDGVTHYVELDHGTMSGSHTIKVDDAVVSRKGMTMSFGGKIPFEISGHPAEIEISSAGFTWDYVLKVDNRVKPQIR